MIAPKSFAPCGSGGARSGEGADCLDWVKMFGARILRLAKYITQSEAEAEDVLVETFLKVCSDGAASQPAEWVRIRLATVAATEALAKLAPPSGAEGPGEDVVIREIFAWGDNYRHSHPAAQTTDILDQAMASLDPMCRAVFVLRDIEEVPAEQTARALNRSVPAVEVCHLRARLQLREQLAHSFRPALADAW